MNLDALCAAALDSKEWLGLFRMRTYARAFRDYKAQYGPAYEEALLEAGEEDTKLRQLAADILDGLERSWKQQRPWNRTAAKLDTHQMVVNYLSPMLLDLPEASARPLCGFLRDEWTARWPKETYQIGSYERIENGFRNVILGIEIGRKRQEGGEDL